MNDQMWFEQRQNAREEQKSREESVKHDEQNMEGEQEKVPGEEQGSALSGKEQKLTEEADKRRVSEMERQRRLAEEEQMRVQEAEIQQLKAEQEHRRAEQERLRLIEQEKLRLAKEQQMILAEEQKRQLAEAEKLRLAEEQQRLLAEEKKRLAEQQQRMLADEQRRLLAEQQQRLLAEEERQKEKELFQLQQQALIEKDEEQRSQTVLSLPPPPPVAFPPGLHIPPPTTAPPPVQPLPPATQQIQQGPPLGHVLTVSQPTASVHVQMCPPPPPPALSSIGALPPPPPAILVSSVQPRAPPPPPGPMPPPPPPSVASSTTMSMPMVQISVTSLSGGAPPPPLPHFSQPPPPVSTAMLATSMPPPPPPIAVSQPVSVATSMTATTKSDSPMPMEVSSVNSTQSNAISAPGAENDKEETIKLPQAVEKVFALKTKRAQQLGVDPDSVITPSLEKDTPASTKSGSITLVSVDEMEDEEDMEDEEANKKAKESKRRHRKKKKKKPKRTSQQNRSKESVNEHRKKADSKPENVDIDIEYVQEVLDPSDPMYSQFIKIFEKFKLHEPDVEKNDPSIEASKEEMLQNAANKVDKKKPADLDDDEDRDDEKKDEEKPKLSKRKLKKLSRMTVAELKQKVQRPELVEMHDVTAKDPVLLLHLKASRNTVPVPRHWCFKRKYLQGKRGIEKPAFELPDFIKRTGIMEMRQALQEKEDQKTMKAKMRERVRPKLGKIDIDYQKLHDAFFKWQTKPKMTIHGDLYYEGKEFETRLKEKKPGDLSDDLRIALGMPTGPNANKCPPPWLIAMQRYGPPPSYPNLKIPGLNAPIPESCSFGYHAGGWGKPPVDEMGRPLYGDVFGTQAADNMPQVPEEEIDHTLWGELESESSEEEEDEDEDEEDEDEQKGEDETGLVTPAEGLITPSGFSSIPAGMETPDMIELRKRKTEAEMEGGETPALYTILPEKKSDRVGAAMMGSTHIYDLSAAIPASKVKASGTTSVPPQGIEVALDPSELEMDTAAMAARYEQTVREQQSQLEKEDLSDMVAEHAARQKTKRKKQQQDSGKAPKKYKEFKF